MDSIHSGEDDSGDQGALGIPYPLGSTLAEGRASEVLLEQLAVQWAIFLAASLPSLIL